MKTFVAFIVLLSAVSSIWAQDRLINRVDRQVGEKTSRIEHRTTQEKNYFRVCLDRQTKVGSPASVQEKTFEITLDQPNLKLGFVDYGSIAGHIKNLTLDDVKLVFTRNQNRETSYDSGWTTSVCFGDLCYPADKDFITPEQAFTLPGSGEAEFKLNITTSLKQEDSILIHLVIAAIGSSEDDTVGLWMTAVSKEPGGVVAADGRTRRSSIQAIYPSPLITGNSIKVNVESIRESAYKYSIYDPFGREVAFGTSQRKLMMGSNVLTISSLEGLGSGSYLLKLSFSDGSSDAYPFTVIR